MPTFHTCVDVETMPYTSRPIFDFHGLALREQSLAIRACLGDDWQPASPVPVTYTHKKAMGQMSTLLHAVEDSSRILAESQDQATILFNGGREGVRARWLDRPFLILFLASDDISVNVLREHNSQAIV